VQAGLEFSAVAGGRNPRVHPGSVLESRGDAAYLPVGVARGIPSRREPDRMLNALLHCGMTKSSQVIMLRGLPV
jgi:hypothetical protein